MSVKDIVHGDVLLAQVYDLTDFEGCTFPTPDDASLQFGMGNFPQGKHVEAHVHKRVDRSVDNTGEFLFVLSGSMEIKVLCEKGQPVETVNLGPNMALLQFYGGHEIDMSSGTRYFELKQGPYLGRDADKFYLGKDSSVSSQ